MTTQHETAERADALPQELQDLLTVIAQLPTDARIQVEPAMARVVESTRRRRRILNLVQEALSQLRLDMKYLMFDLEATRRERNLFRERLNELENDTDL